MNIAQEHRKNTDRARETHAAAFRPWNDSAWARVAAPALLVAALLAAYANSFRCAFQFDDYYIQTTEGLHDPGNPWKVLTVSRPLVELSLAINFAVSGFDSTFSYHVFNFMIHVAATLTLFGLVRRTLRLPRFVDRVTDVEATCLAFAVAILWGLHPLQTQSVTYIIQRAESMMGLFYLWTLYSVCRSFEQRTPRLWTALAVLFCALGALSKQVMVTAPLVALLYDRAFAGPSLREAMIRRWPLYLGLAATWMIFLVTGSFHEVFAGGPNQPAAAGFGVPTITPLQYLMTQGGVVLHYLRLAVWPDRLCFDHDWPIARTFADAAVPCAIVFVLIAGGVVALYYRPIAGFVAASFFLILLPTSGFIPIKDVIVEHRMYLPLAAPIVLLVCRAWRMVNVLRASAAVIPRMPVLAAAMLLTSSAAALGWRTFARNYDYATGVSLWSSVITQYPNSARAHNNLGVGYTTARQDEDAVAAFREAVRLEPRFSRAYTSMGQALLRLERGEEAVEAYRMSAELEPNSWQAVYNYGAVLVENGRESDGREVLESAKAIDPTRLEPYINIGNVLTDWRLFDEAVAELQSGLDYASPSTPPDLLAKANFNLANSYARLKQYELAVESYLRAVADDPKHDMAYYGMGFSLQQLQRFEDAEAAYDAAVRINPENRTAKEALESMRRGRSHRTDDS